MLSDNAGTDATKMVAQLYTAHHKGEQNAGVDIETKAVGDKAADGILDLFATKESAIRLATDAALTVLRVDQIIMSKPAGGPKPPAQR